MKIFNFYNLKENKVYRKHGHVFVMGNYHGSGGKIITCLWPSRVIYRIPTDLTCAFYAGDMSCIVVFTATKIRVIDHIVRQLHKMDNDFEFKNLGDKNVHSNGNDKLFFPL